MDPALRLDAASGMESTVEAPISPATTDVERAGGNVRNQNASASAGMPSAAAPVAPSASRQTTRASAWGVLRHKHFRIVWGASFVSNIGNWMEMLGIQMIVAHQTGSLKMLGLLAGAQLAPVMVLGMFGGVVADRVNRRTLLVVTQALLMVMAILVALLSMFGAPEVVTRLGEALHLHRLLGDKFGTLNGLVLSLFLISIGQGTIMAFNMPAWQVLTPRLVPREELTAAITINGIQFNAARAVGPALAGAISAQFGYTPLFVVNAVSFTAVLVAVMFTPDAPAEKRTRENPWREIAQAVGFVTGSLGPLAVFLATVLMSLLAAPLVRMMPLYVIDVYGVKAEAAADQVVGYLLTILGIGAVVGGLALRRLPGWYPKHHFIPVSIAGAGLSITLFALTPTMWSGYLVMFVVGVFWIWGFNQSWAALQSLVSDTMRGRVMAFANVASFGATAVGNLAAGWIGDTIAQEVTSPVLGVLPKQLGTHAAILVLSVVLMGAGIVMMIWRVPEIDGMPRIKGMRKSKLDFYNAITAAEHRPAGRDTTDDHHEAV